MQLTEPLGPTSTKLFKFLKKEGVLEEFIKNCDDVNKLVRNQDSAIPDKYWNDYNGGFSFYYNRGSLGRATWFSLANKAADAGVYDD